MIHWHYLAWAAAAVCFGLALLGVLATGMASRQLTSEDFRMSRTCAMVGVVLVILTLVACAPKPPIGIEVRSVEVPTPVPCLDRDQIPTEPAPVRDKLTGNAVVDSLILAESALELRKWGGRQQALLQGCVE